MQSLTVLTFCAQWMVLAALLEEAEVAAQDRTVWRILTSQAACADNA